MLGVFEAGVYPSAVYLLATWYSRCRLIKTRMLPTPPCWLSQMTSESATSVSMLSAVSLLHLAASWHTVWCKWTVCRASLAGGGFLSWRASYALSALCELLWQPGQVTDNTVDYLRRILPGLLVLGWLPRISGPVLEISQQGRTWLCHQADQQGSWWCDDRKLHLRTLFETCAVSSKLDLRFDQFVSPYRRRPSSID